MENVKNITDWHAGFRVSARLEFRDDEDCLEYFEELILGEQPPRLDLLIIKKDPERKLKNEIGEIFRRLNILEYKGPGDALDISDFYKVCGYSCIYISVQEKDIPF